MAGSKEKLVRFLDEKAFDPVLKARPDDFSGSDRDKLQDVQEATRAEQKRYHDNYSSAHEVYVNFKRDLDSEPAQKIHRELRALNLPTLGDFKDEFERMARDEGAA